MGKRGPKKGWRRHGKLGDVLHSEKVRERIQSAQLVELLQQNALGKLINNRNGQPYELSMSRLKSIDILLRKTVPDMTQIDFKADVQHRFVVEIPAQLEDEEWEATYGSLSMPTIDLKQIKEIKQ